MIKVFKKSPDLNLHHLIGGEINFDVFLSKVRYSFKIINKNIKNK